MAFKEYGSYDGVGLADLVRKKQVSAHELLDEAIARTARVDPQINAVVVKHYDHAKRQIDKGLADGPFSGVPFLLKDLEILEGTRTTFGASVYKDNVADHSGTLAQRFLDAGLTIFGKTSTPEFGLMVGSRWPRSMKTGARSSFKRSASGDADIKSSFTAATRAPSSSTRRSPR